MSSEPFPSKSDVWRSIEDLLETSRRLRQKAKENVEEADRIMALVKKLEKVLTEEAQHLLNRY